MSNINASEKKLWSQLWIWLRDEKLMLLLLSIVIIGNVVVSIIGPLFLKKALDLVYVSEYSNIILLYTFIYAFMLVLIFFAQMLQSIIIAIVNSRFIHTLRQDVFEKVLNNSISFFDNSISGKLVSRVVNDSNELASSADRLSNTFAQFFVFMGVFVTMMIYDIKLAMASISVVPILFFAVILMRKMQRRISLRWRSKIAIVNANFGETMSSLSVSKSFGREKENFDKFNYLNEETYIASKARAKAIFAVGPIQDFLKHFGIILLIYVATTINSISVSLLYLFILLQGYLYNPISQIARAYNQFQTSFAALERLLMIMANDDTQEDCNLNGLYASQIVGDVKFKKVNFSYIKNEPVLFDLDFHIPAGQTTALIGQTGAGKSTIVSLIMKFYDGYTGEILIDDVNINSYQLHSLRENVAYVAQDVFLFTGSILENLQMAKPTATLKQVQQALDAVQATEFINTLPEGIHTLIHEEGKNLSQGQKQMISLARALLADPKILILDEFTASLDLYTEAKIQEGIARLISGRTSIVIAHRLTTILKSDKIVVLENGSILEEGTHDELLKRDGAYSSLFRKYFSFQVSDLKIKV